MRIAFATHDHSNVDAHFASARTFLFYDVGKEEHNFVEAIEFSVISNEDGVHADEGDDRLSAKIEALEGASLLFVRAIGGPAAARVIKAQVHPVKLPNDEPIAAVISRLQVMLQTNPPPWLRKALQGEKKGPERFIDDGE